jgi:hypothetical protein
MPRLRSATDFGTANSLLPLQRRANLLKPPEFDLRVSGFPDRLPETIIKPQSLSIPNPVSSIKSSKRRFRAEDPTYQRRDQRRSGHSIHSNKRSSSVLLRRWRLPELPARDKWELSEEGEGGTVLLGSLSSTPDAYSGSLPDPLSLSYSVKNVLNEDTPLQTTFHLNS